MTKAAQPLKFEGKDLREKPPGAHEKAPQDPEPYIAGDRLKTAVNLAIALRRPLLLEGDPGCGKTCLARAVAFELGLPFFRWNVQSISKAQEGQYVYDALGRLHDVQLQKGEKEPRRDPSHPADYCEMGALGEAFQIKDCASVVLIDEIDKAELDFPNDLLTVLDQPWKFQIKETGEWVEADPDHLPIVFITSNKEKGNLPDAFLRRCLYHYVEFPNDPKELKKIIARHYEIEALNRRADEDVMPPEAELQEAAIDRFLLVRDEGGLIKKPGTSEFLDWLKALQTFMGEPYSAKKLIETDQEENKLPYPELLLKVYQDWRKFKPAL
jgi:MoxR-like ATPase